MHFLQKKTNSFPDINLSYPVPESTGNININGTIFIRQFRASLEVANCQCNSGLCSAKVSIGLELIGPGSDFKKIIGLQSGRMPEQNQDFQ